MTTCPTVPTPESPKDVIIIYSHAYKRGKTRTPGLLSPPPRSAVVLQQARGVGSGSCFTLDYSAYPDLIYRMTRSYSVRINPPSDHKPTSTTIPQGLDEPEGYSPMNERTWLLSDGRHFYQVSSYPPYLDFSFNIELDLAWASTRPIPALTTPTLMVPAVAVPPLAASAGAGASAGVGVGGPPAQAGAGTEAEREAQTTTHEPLSDRAARAHIAAYIRGVEWYQAHAVEPCVGEAGVPACALQLAQEGESIWACFVQRLRRRGIGMYKCVGCGHVTRRRSRAIGHQRAEWEHKPFACADPGW